MYRQRAAAELFEPCSGTISTYYATRTLLPAKTRVFVDFVVEAFSKQRLAQRFAGSLG